MACSVEQGSSVDCTILQHVDTMLRLVVISWKAAPAGFLAQSQTQGIDQEVPGLMLLFHKAAGAQAQDMACRAQHQEKVHL